MNYRTMLAGAVLAAGCAACASSAADPKPLSDYQIEAFFEQADGARVVAPRVTCAEGQAVNVCAVRPYKYVQDYEVEVGQDDFHADPVMAQVDEGVWLDLRVQRATGDRIEVWYRLRRATLKQPVETFTTTLGAFTKPVTIEIPELVTRESEGVGHLDAGTRAALVRLTSADGSDPLTVFARVSPVQIDDSDRRSGETINLDTE